MTRLSILLGAVAMFGAAALPSASRAACPAPTASGKPPLQLADKNGAGQEINQQGIVVAGAPAQGAADDRDKASNRAQGAADDRDKPSNRAQGAAATQQLAQGLAGSSCN